MRSPPGEAFSTRGSVSLWRGAFRQRARHQPGGPLLALRDGAACAESRLRSVTGGNGAIYATRRESYFEVDPIMGHDSRSPSTWSTRLARGIRSRRPRGREDGAVDRGRVRPQARMTSHGWPIVVRGGMLSPRGYDPLYALMIFSHRILRYASPLLHLTALGREHRAARARRRVRGRRAAGGRPVGGAARLTGSSEAAVGRALLRPDHGLARRGVVGLACDGKKAGWEPAEGTR